MDANLDPQLTAQQVSVLRPTGNRSDNEIVSTSITGAQAGLTNLDEDSEDEESDILDDEEPQNVTRHQTSTSQPESSQISRMSKPQRIAAMTHKMHLGLQGLARSYAAEYGLPIQTCLDAVVLSDYTSKRKKRKLSKANAVTHLTWKDKKNAENEGSESPKGNGQHQDLMSEMAAESSRRLKTDFYTEDQINSALLEMEQSEEGGNSEASKAPHIQQATAERLFEEVSLKLWKLEKVYQISGMIMMLPPRTLHPFKAVCSVHGPLLKRVLQKRWRYGENPSDTANTMAKLALSMSTANVPKVNQPASDKFKALSKRQQRDQLQSILMESMKAKGFVGRQIPWSHMAEFLWTSACWWKGLPIDFKWAAYSQGSGRVEDGRPVDVLLKAYTQGELELCKLSEEPDHAETRKRLLGLLAFKSASPDSAFRKEFRDLESEFTPFDQTAFDQLHSQLPKH